MHMMFQYGYDDDWSIPKTRHSMGRDIIEPTAAYTSACYFLHADDESWTFPLRLSCVEVPVVISTIICNILHPTVGQDIILIDRLVG
jgi:hypothetical protein